MKRTLLSFAIIAACCVCAFAWWRATRGAWITGPQHVTWRDAHGKRLARSEVRDRWCHAMSETFVVGDRLILRCARGFAFVEPATRSAKLAWPIADVESLGARALAIHPDGRWAVMVTAFRGETQVAMLGVAGRDGWVTVPALLWEGDRKQLPQPLALAWRGDAVELVLTRPSEDDDYGTRHPPEVVRIAEGVVTRRALALPCCSLMGALPGPRGWRLVALTDAREAVVIDGEAVAPVPPELAWWATYTHLDTDRAAVGLLDSSSPEPVLELDGSRRAPGDVPFPGFEAQHVGERRALIDGVLRTRRLWAHPDDEGLATLALRVGGESFAIGRRGDLMLVGRDPARLRPVVRDTISTHFMVGELLPRQGGGHYWTTGAGAYVTLDGELRRTDRLGLAEHLRQRGSIGDTIDEPAHARRLYAVLFGLPIALVLGLLVSIRTRTRLAPIAAACGIYAVSATYALAKVLPLLA